MVNERLSAKELTSSNPADVIMCINRLNPFMEQLAIGKLSQNTTSMLFRDFAGTIQKPTADTAPAA